MLIESNLNKHQETTATTVAADEPPKVVASHQLQSTVENPKSSENQTTTNSTSKSKQEKILAQKIKHENRIKNLERLIELEKMKAKKLERIIDDGKQSASNSSHIYDSILNDDENHDDGIYADEADEVLACRCCCCCGGQVIGDEQVAGSSCRRQQLASTFNNEASGQTKNTSTGSTSDPVASTQAVCSSPDPRPRLSQNASMSSSHERSIPVVVEKRSSESWFYSVDNPKYSSKGILVFFFLLLLKNEKFSNFTLDIKYLKREQIC